MYKCSNSVRQVRLMPLEPSLRKPIDARWSFKIVDMDRRLVAFHDDSEGQISSWACDFGDGTTSTEQNPLHTYQDPGQYIVQLTVNGPRGTSKLQKIWDVVLR